MARRKKSTPRRGSWFVLIVGMVLGVAAAVAVALFVTQVPMPFKDKASRSTPATLLPDVANAPDPNIALYGKDGAAGSRSIEQGGSGLPPPADTPRAVPDGIAKIIAGLDPSPPPPPAPAPPAKPSTAKPAAGTQTTYYLQTGAFRSSDEAQAMLARVVLLGLPVRIETGVSNDAPINRVRVGPFKGIDEMNEARTRLGDEKIESTVIRP